MNSPLSICRKPSRLHCTDERPRQRSPSNRFGFTQDVKLSASRRDHEVPKHQKPLIGAALDRRLLPLTWLFGRRSLANRIRGGGEDLEMGIHVVGIPSADRSLGVMTGGIYAQKRVRQAKVP